MLVFEQKGIITVRMKMNYDISFAIPDDFALI
jgi:hypothetical protein